MSGFLVLFSNCCFVQNSQKWILEVIPLQVSLNVNGVNTSCFWWVLSDTFVLNAFFGISWFFIIFWKWLQCTDSTAFRDFPIDFIWNFFSFGFVLSPDSLFKFLELFYFFIISRKLTNTFFMFCFAFIDKSLLMSFGFLSGLLQSSFELSLFLVNPFNVLAFLKIDMIVDSFKLVSGLFVGNSFISPSDNVIDTCISVFLFDFYKCAMSASHVFRLW